MVGLRLQGAGHAERAKLWAAGGGGGERRICFAFLPWKGELARKYLRVYSGWKGECCCWEGGEAQWDGEGEKRAHSDVSSGVQVLQGGGIDALGSFLARSVCPGGCSWCCLEGTDGDVLE